MGVKEMQLLHNNILTEKKLIEAKSEGGLFLPKAPEERFVVISCGPKVKNLKPGDVVKPMGSLKGTSVGEHYLFKEDQIDLIY